MTTRQFTALPMFERGEIAHAMNDAELAEFTLDRFDPVYGERHSGLAADCWRDLAQELARRVARKAPVLEDMA